MKVTLKKDHTHNDVKYKAGSTVDVPVHDALWLKAADLIDEGLDAIKAEAKKLVTKENPTPHAEAIARAEKAEADRKAAATASAQTATSSGLSASSASSTEPPATK